MKLVICKIASALLFLLFIFTPIFGHCAGLLAVVNPSENGQTRQAYVAIEAFEGNDQVSMTEYGGDWSGHYAPRNGVNLGLAMVRMESGVQLSGYRLGGIFRAEALLQTNRDSSDLVQQSKTSASYSVNRTYSLDYKIKAFQADGVRFSKAFRFESTGKWQIDGGVGLSKLRGRHISLSNVQGEVVAVTPTEFSGSAKQSVSDSSINTLPLTATGVDLLSFNAPFGRQAQAYGSGYALDLGIVMLHPTTGTRLSIAVDDISGRIDWRDVPTNISNYSTSTKYYDANRYLNSYPSSTRTSSYENIGQTLDPKWLMTFSRPVGNFELLGALNYTQGYWFPQVGISYPVLPKLRMKVDYDVRFETIVWAIEHDLLIVSLRSDNWRIEAAKAYGLTASFKIPL
jgi:hypothetical protein